MTRLCDKVELFVDGELPFEEAETFRLHFPDCPRCQAEMAHVMQLKLLGHRQTKRSAEHASGGSSRSISRLRWRSPVMVAVASLAAAMMVVVVMLRSPTPLLPQGDRRRMEHRLSYYGPNDYRPMASVPMGDGATLPEADSVEQGPSLEVMSVLEKKDEHGLSVAYLRHDEPEKAEKVLKRLRARGRSPDLDSDLAVAMLQQGKIKEALQLLDEVLEEHPSHPQALWNRGLALRDLELPLMAAQAFSKVVALNEVGWSEEARKRAEALEAPTYKRRDRWQAVFEAGRALRDAAPGTLPSGFAESPYSRRLFYDAVRSAPSGERVLALLPIAQMLDQRAGGDVLVSYVRRVAEADFARRAPLARTYAELAWKRLPKKEDQERFLAALLASKEDDILLGALDHMNATTSYLSLFEAKAAASGDPWLQMLAVQKRADAEAAAGRVTQAAELLLKERRPCLKGFEYLCISLDTALSTLYLKLQRIDDARQYAESALKMARKNNDWGLEQAPLWNLAQIAKLGKDTSLAHAYLGEFLENSRDNADAMRRNHQDRAVIAMEDLQVEEARREIDAALATGLPLALSGAFALADISRLRPAPGDEQHLTEALEKIRPTLSPGEKAIATHVLGRFFIERDVERGHSLLLQAIQEAEALGLREDNGARRARAYSFTSLLLEAGKRGAFQEALKLFAQERGGELPSRCLLAATVDSERTLLLALGPTGELKGYYDAARSRALPQRLESLVPEKLVQFLRSCEQVDVLARPVLHGRAGMLPSDLAWSYLTSPPERRRSPTGPAIHLVVSEVKLPPEVSLNRLNDWTPTFGPEEQQITLSGSQATPAQVLSDMKYATEIDLVAHGIIHDYSDTSYLVLAEGPEGYKLGVSKVRTASLLGAPFVVLAACHAAHTTALSADPFSLPTAFIEAGARGVLAATVEIPDREAEAFFNAIREQMRSGVAPKVALRDERVRWLREDKRAQWLESVLLFE